MLSQNIFVGTLAVEGSVNVTWKQAQPRNTELALYSSHPKDRTCLLSPQNLLSKQSLILVMYESVLSLSS